MKGEEWFDSITDNELTRSLAQKGGIKRNKIGCDHKTAWYSYKEHAGNKHQKEAGDMQRPGMTCSVP